MTTLITASSSAQLTPVNALGNVLEALAVSENKILEEGRKTVSKCANVGSTLMLRVTDISDENRTLRTQLVLTRSQQQEIKGLDQAIVLASQDEAAAAQNMVTIMRKEMIEASLSADERIKLLFTAQTDAIQQTQLTCDAQLFEAQQAIAALRQEIATSAQRAEQDRTATTASHASAIQTAKQAADAQVASARLEVEQWQHELVKATHQADERVTASSQIDDAKLLAFFKKKTAQDRLSFYRTYLGRRV
jgi:hypothetical protein